MEDPGGYTIYFETAAGVMLGDALGLLRDACSADALYRPPAPDESFEDQTMRRDEGVGRQLAWGRQATALAVFACEGFINEFVERVRGPLTRADVEVIERKLSTLDKYVLVPRMLDHPLRLSRGQWPVSSCACCLSFATSSCIQSPAITTKARSIA